MLPAGRPFHSIWKCAHEATTPCHIRDLHDPGACRKAENARAVTQVASPAQLNGTLRLENFENEAFVSGVAFSASSGITRYTADQASGGVTTSGI